MISYKVTNVGNTNRDGYHDVLTSAKAHFEEQHKINILGEGYSEIIGDDSLFGDYRSCFLKGMDANSIEDMSDLIDNSRVHTLAESLAGITPISSLSVPIIRKLWPRMALKEAIPTEVVKLPKFSYSYMLPYIFKSGTKHYLPEAIMDNGDAQNMVDGTPLYQGDIMLEDFTIDGNATQGALKGFDLLENLPDGALAAKTMGDSVDSHFYITAVIIETTDLSATTANEVIPCRVGTGLHDDIFFAAEKYADADYVADVLQPGAALSASKLYGKVDRSEGILYLACDNGLIKGVRIAAKLSTEFNNHTESISFDTKTKDIVIGTGPHLDAPLPIEFLQDTMALFKVDAASKVVDIMTSVFALKLDHEARDFIIGEYVNAPQYLASFDCKPIASFTGTPKEWREVLKDLIDHWAAKLKQDHMFTGGRFVIVGNELDVSLISNVSWQFGNSDASERSGVRSDYNVGAISGAKNYTVIGSTAIPKGSLYMFFVSDQDEMMTFKYFPYAFNVEKGYTSPNRPYVPSIMMTKRHVFESFKKGTVVKIDITNNDGNYNFT